MITGVVTAAYLATHTDLGSLLLLGHETSLTLWLITVTFECTVANAGSVQRHVK
jgi:hypothetical protein